MKYHDFIELIGILIAIFSLWWMLSGLIYNALLIMFAGYIILFINMILQNKYNWW